MIALFVAAAPVDAGSCEKLSDIRAPSERLSYLMLRNCSDFRIGGSESGARVRLKADLSGVSLQSTEYQSVNHTVNISSGFRVGEGLVGCSLL